MAIHPNNRYNILVVDWGNQNCSSIVTRVNQLLSYNTHADCTTDVGLQVAQMLVFLLHNGVINNTGNIHIVGFSLGAHVAGQAGRSVADMTGDKVARITGTAKYNVNPRPKCVTNFFRACKRMIGVSSGLDPAGPMSPWWNIFPKHHRDLGLLDADFVDVIHTSGLLGAGRRMGHVDFYLNGGTEQPGCIPDPMDYVINDFLRE